MTSLNQSVARGETFVGSPVRLNARIRNIGVVTYGAPLQVSPLEIAGGIGGAGLLIGGLVIEGPPGIAMAILGGLTLLGTAVSLLPRTIASVSQPAAPPPPLLPPPPLAPPKLTRTQQVTSYASIAMPFVEGLLKIF